MEDNGSSTPDLGAYCTLRSDGRKKKHQQVHFGSLRVPRKVDHQIASNDIPYSQLNESQSSAKGCSQLFDENDRNEMSCLSDSCDLINLNDSLGGVSSLPLNMHCSNTLGKSSRIDSGQPLHEFKRLSSYCTLRPDQKRKYLLRSLSLLRKSKATAITADEANRALEALQRLDADVHDDDNDDDESASSAFSDPQIVEDCLLELDAYLEEIDRKCTCQSNSGSTDALQAPKDVTPRIPVDQVSGHAERLHGKYAYESSAISSVNDESGYSDFLRRFGNDSDDGCGGAAAMVDDGERENGAPVVLTTQCDNDIEMSTNAKASGGAMARGHPYRNTISATCDNTTFPRTQRENPSTARRHSTWRRNSMRKTRPIALPDQSCEQPAHFLIDTIPSHFARPCSPTTSSSSATMFADDTASFDGSTHNDTLPLVEAMEQAIASAPPRSPCTVPTETTSHDIRFDHFDDPLHMHHHLHHHPHDPINQPQRSLGDEYLHVLTQQLTDEQLVQAAIDASNREHSNFQFYSDDEVNDDGTVATASRITNDSQSQYLSRPPRQMGRRAEGRARVVSITAETNSAGNQQQIIVNHDRPMSAPARVTATTSSSRPAQQQPILGSSYNVSEPSSVNSTRNTSPVSLISSSASSASTTSGIDQPPRRNSERPTPPRRAPEPESSADEQADDTEKSKRWPHGFSRILTTTCCTLGLFNMSRFAIFSIHFGANFIVQFIILSVIFGVPMLWLQMCLGSNLRRGPVSMWRISPICKGIGIALLLVQALVAMYSAVVIAWLLIYFRDSFALEESHYRWQETFELFRGPAARAANVTGRLIESVADYFNGVVLQRFHLASGLLDGTHMGMVNFHLVFNMAVLWIIVFGVLSEGLRSFGKVVFGLMVVPLIGLGVVCTKMLTMINANSLQNIFPSTDWQEFFLNTQSWLSAAQECFLTWALLGSSVISMFSKATCAQERNTVLRRDAIIVCVITLLGLILSALMGNACVQILSDNGYFYDPGSYEDIDSYVYLVASNSSQTLTRSLKWLPRYSTVLGEGYRRIGMNPHHESGFSTLRLVFELFPATVAIANISSTWAILGFFVFICFAIGQLSAMWKPIAEALGSSMSAVLLSCVTGLLLAMPLATESGINIIHFLDMVLGGAWFVVLLWIAHIFGVFLVRGRPYTGDILVNDLRLTHTLAAFVALSWNVLLPIGMMTLCILEYKASNARDLYHWRGKAYWPMWVRKCGGFLQVSCLLVVPITSIVQIYRYLSNGPPDILDRIQLLYRPSLLPASSQPQSRYAETRTDRPRPMHAIPATISLETSGAATTVNDDAPPKYTPPPSYTTATGARLAKMLRNSIRRSVRRIMGEPSSRRPCLHAANLANISLTGHALTDDLSLPPAYSTVQVSTSPPPPPTLVTHETDIVGPRVLYNSQTHRDRTLKAQRRRTTTPSQTVTPVAYGSETLPRTQSSGPRRASQSITATDVAQILRPSLLQQQQQQQRAASLGECVDQEQLAALQRSLSTRSAEQLMLDAAPPGHSSIIELDRDGYDDGPMTNSSVI